MRLYSVKIELILILEFKYEISREFNYIDIAK